MFVRPLIFLLFMVVVLRHLCIVKYSALYRVFQKNGYPVLFLG